jgi:hypothetical protein
MAAEKQQFQLPLTVTTCRLLKLAKTHNGTRERSSSDRLVGIDQVLSTHDVERITGKHRCTIWRWVLAGTFLPKRAGRWTGLASIRHRAVAARKRTCRPLVGVA